MSVVAGLFTGFLKDFLNKKVFTNENRDRIKNKFFKKSRYFKRLKVLLKDMPFIYKDFDLEVINDFQHIEAIKLKSTIIKTLDFEEPVKNNERNEFTDWFKVEKKVLTFGDAGVGKSTLMRFLVLSILQRKKIRYLNYDKDTIPVFIQLKAILGNQKSPLINYLLEEVEMYKGKSGLKTLEKHLIQRRLIFILDGYDEISFVGGDNYLQHELGVFFSTQLSSEKIGSRIIDMKFYDLYKLISDSKVILTTREEFYRLNPLEDFQTLTFGSFNTVIPSFKAMRLLGLGNLRFNFVKVIFDKQKLKGAIYKEALDPELFIAEIDTLEDEEMTRFSKIPLFLTIMIYIYVCQVRDGLSTKYIWETTTEKLIQECVITLLKDIDEYKVKELSEAKKKAFSKRRNDFYEEKIRFLEFFAYSLLNEQKAVFDFDYLKTKVFSFFSEGSQFETADKIILGHNRKEAANPNFSEQLLYSGVFTNVCLIGGKLNFDFPHRRFKEILAANYLASMKETIDLSSLFENKHASEFFVYSFRKSQKNYKEKIILQVLEYCKTESYSYITQLLGECLELRDIEQFSDLFYAQVPKWIDLNVRIRINQKLIQKFHANQIVVDNLISHYNSLGSNKYHALNLIFALLREFMKKNFNTFLKQNEGGQSNAFSKIIFQKYEYYYYSDYLENELYKEFQKNKRDDKSKKFFYNYDAYLRKTNGMNAIDKAVFLSSVKPNEYTFASTVISDELSKDKQSSQDALFKFSFLFCSNIISKSYFDHYCSIAKPSRKYLELLNYVQGYMPFTKSKLRDMYENIQIKFGENYRNDKNSSLNDDAEKDEMNEMILLISSFNLSKYSFIDFLNKYSNLDKNEISSLEDIIHH